MSEKCFVGAAATGEEPPYCGLYEHMSQGVLFMDAEGRILSANMAAERILGLSFEQMQGKTSTDPQWRVVAEDGTEVPGVDHPALEALRTGRKAGPRILGVFHPGRVDAIWLNIVAIPLFRPDSSDPFQVCVTLEDITERKHVEDELIQTRERLALAIDGSSDGIWDWGLRDNSLYLSPRWKEQLGYADGELANEFATFETRIHPDDRDRVLALADQYLKGETDHYAAEFRMRHKDGEYRWILARGAALRDPDGIPYRVAGSHADITERKRAESALQQNEARLQLALEVAQMGHWRYDCATHAVEWFSGHDKLFGISKEEFGGNIDAVQEMVHPDDRAHGMANIQKAIENHVPFDNTYRVTHRDGSIHWLHSYGHVFDGPDGRPDHIFGVTQDITHRKTTELELERRGNKLRELAEELTRCEERQRRDMALRLHDGVGQLLSVVKMKLREREVQAESLAQERELAAIRGIVEQALADTRTLTGELASPLLYEAGLVPALGWLLEQFQQRHPDLRFHLLDSPEPDHRECRLLLFQIARELLFNVVKHAGAGQAWVGLAIEGPWIRMRVRDDGVGGGSIADLAGMRTDCGFGLFSIRERIGMHGGELDVNSPPGGGTEVTVTYPLSAKDKPA